MNNRGALEINLLVRERERRLTLLTLAQPATKRPGLIHARELRIKVARVLRRVALRVDPAVPLSRQAEPG